MQQTAHPHYGSNKLRVIAIARPPVTAALAVKRFLRVETVVPCHYGSFPIIEPNADKFVAEMKGDPTKVIVPEKGKAFTV